MSIYDNYSLSGCLIDQNYQGPKLQSLGGTDPMGTMGAGAEALPPVVDLRQYCSAVEDQLTTSSCVANAVVGSLELLQRKQGHSTQDLSRAFVYYNSRKLHCPQIEDQGTFVHTAMAAILAHGICEERLWPLSVVTINDCPTQACYTNAENYRGVEFAQIADGTPLTHVLARGIPVVIGVGFPMEAYHIADATGVLQLPENGGTAHQHSNHSMVVVGYDLEQKMYLVRNSWGANWSKGGYFQMPIGLFHQASMNGQSWAIGSLNQAPGLRLLGASVPAAAAGMEQAAKELPLAPDAGKALRDEVQGQIDSARAGFASRLRGGN